MCSKNTSNNVANASGVVGDHDCYEISSLRKAKKKRIPKRGPGVAELEKILREQEKKDGHVENGKMIAGISPSFVSSLPNTYLLPSSFASSSNCSRRNVAFFPDSDRNLINHLANSTPSIAPHLQSTLHVNGINGDLKGRIKVVYIDESGVFLPEQTLLPITWGSYSETRKGEEASKTATDFSFPTHVSNGSDHTRIFHPPMVQKIDLHASKQINLFPLSTISSSATPSSSSSSAGVHHHVEPPSNQKSCHNYTSILPEEDKMIGAKRSRPNFPVDISPPAPPHMPCQSLPFHPQISRLDPSSSNNAVLNPGTASRDLMPSNPLELKARTCVNDHENPSGNCSAFITLGSPTAPLSSTQNIQPDFSNFIKQFPLQEMKESTKGLSQMSSSSPELSVQKKSSFFSFLLQPEEQRDATGGTADLQNTENCTEKTEELIDLSLRL